MPKIKAQNSAILSGSQLVDGLNALGVHFLRGGSGAATTKNIDPATLLSALAMSDEARLRLALIPLLLQRPDLATFAGVAEQQLPAPAQLVFKCYYTAARLLQQKYLSRLEALLGQHKPLPDRFSAELGIAAYNTPQAGLQALAKQHSTLSGKSINWLGTYEHGARRLLRQLEREKLWNR